MKINWGTSIVLAYSTFIVFILYFVVKTFTQPEYDYDLVSEQYYQEELEFQNTINHTKKANKLEDEVTILKTEKGLQILIPNALNNVIVGEIKFYRPSNDQLDFSKKFNTTKNTYAFSDSVLVKGRWNISVKWHYKNNNDDIYFYKKSIYY